MITTTMTTLSELFDNEQNLSPTQIARCAKVYPQHVIALCFMDHLPFRIRAEGRYLSVASKQLAKYFDAEVFDFENKSPPISVSISKKFAVEAWFQAELKLSINLLGEQNSIQQITEVIDAFMSPASEDKAIENLASKAQLSSLQAHWIARVHEMSRLPLRSNINASEESK